MLNKAGISLVLLILLGLCSCGPGNQQEQNSKNKADSIKAAIENLDRKIAANETDPELYNARAKYYLADRQPDRALKDINKALSIAPQEPKYYITLSDIYLLMGQPEECSNALKKALGYGPENNDVLMKLARLSLIQKDYKGLNEYVNQAIRIRKNNPQAYYLHALALLETGDTANAVKDLMTAYGQDPGAYDVLVQLGELFSIKKDPLAESYLKNALKIRPTSKEALYMLGMYYQETGQLENAIRTYSILAGVDTTYRSAPYNIGYIYLVYLHNFPKAAFFFTEAIKRDPAYVEAWFNRGYAYELAKEYDKASADYKKALELRPNYDKAVEAMNRLDRIKYRP